MSLKRSQLYNPKFINRLTSQLYPNCPDIIVLRSLVQLMSGKPSAALEQATSALRLDPDNLKAKALRFRVKTLSKQKDDGNAHFRALQWIEAIEKYDEALMVCHIRYLTDERAFLIFT